MKMTSLFFLFFFYWRVIRKNRLLTQMVKNLPAMQETQVQFLGQEDPLEKGMATPFSILAWRIPWTEEDNCFTILCWPLPYINMNRPQAYIRPPPS